MAVHPDPSLRESSFDFKLDQLMERKRGLSAQLLMPGETDGDLDHLFDSLFEQGNAGATDVSAFDQDPAGTGTPPPSEVEPKREILTPRVGPIQEVSPAPKMVRYNPGDQRDWSIFTENLSNRGIEHLVVRDPYAIAGRRNRAIVADFAAQLARKVPIVSRVTVIAWDAESARQDNYETTQRAIDEMEREWDRRFFGRVPLILELKSRGQDRGFHDRWVDALLDDGEKISWNFTSGVDGFMDTNSECMVTLWGA